MGAYMETNNTIVQIVFHLKKWQFNQNHTIFSNFISFFYKLAWDSNLNLETNEKLVNKLERLSLLSMSHVLLHIDKVLMQWTGSLCHTMNKSQLASDENKTEPRPLVCIIKYTWHCCVLVSLVLSVHTVYLLILDIALEMWLNALPHSSMHKWQPCLEKQTSLTSDIWCHFHSLLCNAHTHTTCTQPSYYFGVRLYHCQLNGSHCKASISFK